MSETSSLLSSLRRFLGGTLLSRFSGLVREVAMAAAFGTNPAVASFWMAFRFANLFRRLFGEGGLNVAFIPHFEELKKNSPAEAATFFHTLTRQVTLLLFALVVVCEGVLGGFYFLGNFSLETEEILLLTMLMLPSLIFLSLYALNTALLNTERRFFLPSVAPVVVNVLWVAATFFLKNLSTTFAMPLLACAVVIAFGGQWLLTALPARSYIQKFSLQKCHQNLLPFLRPFFLAILGVTAQQINGAIDALFAKTADPEGPAYLWYALRVQQLPFALLGVGLMSALLPPLSRSSATLDVEKYLHLLNFSLKKVTALMIPLTCGIGVLGLCGINLLFGRGAFSEHATYQTTYCLWAYGAALLPMAHTLLLASAFYAMKNYKIPTLLACISLALNTLLNYLFVNVLHMSAVSIALATTVASVVNAATLGHFLQKKRGRYWEGLPRIGLRVTLLSLFAAGCTLLVGEYLQDNTLRLWTDRPLLAQTREIKRQLFIFGMEGFTFTATLMGGAFLCKMKELTELLNVGGTRSRKLQEY